MEDDAINLTLEGGPDDQRRGVREIIAEALNTKGYFVTIVGETSGYEYDHRGKGKTYSAPGHGQSVYLMGGN